MLQLKTSRYSFREVNLLANIRSARKRARQAERRRLRNVSTRSAIKTAIRRFEDALSAEDLETAKKPLGVPPSSWTKPQPKGIIHKNMAARKNHAWRKARLFGSRNSKLGKSAPGAFLFFVYRGGKIKITFPMIPISGGDFLYPFPSCNFQQEKFQDKTGFQGPSF